MRRLVLLVACIAAPSLGAGPAGDRFTLVCDGNRETLDESSPAHFELRVDLRSAKWCDDKCDDVRSFAKIERDRLTFSESDTDTMTQFSYVDRRTGEYTQVVRSSIFRSKTKAVCVRAPYKPITYRKRAF